VESVWPGKLRTRDEILSARVTQCKKTEDKAQCFVEISD